MSSLRSKFVDNLKPKQAYTSKVERESRAQRKLQDRRNTRAAEFSRNRNIGESKENIEIEAAQTKLYKDPQRLKLERWKEERKRQKLASALLSKPAFVCGVVRHHVGSPYKSLTEMNSEKLLIYAKATINPGRKQRAVSKTRAAQKQESEALIAVPANFQFKAPKGVKALTIPAQPLKPSNAATSKRQHYGKVSQRVTRSMAIAEQNSSTFNFSQSDQSNIAKRPKREAAVEAMTPLYESVPMKQEDSACETEQNDTDMKQIGITTPVSKTSKADDEYLPVHYSPFVTKQRGSSRKSTNTSRLDYSGTPKGERTLNTEKELETRKERDGVVYFRNILQSEVQRLEETIEKWFALRNSTPDLPEEICDLIDVAVGKARLLIKQKLHQFGTLISQCEAGSVPGMPGVTVKCCDLEGFWDMVYIQVEDIDTKFKMLEDAKSRNWQKDNLSSPQMRVKKVRKNPIRKGKKDVAKSSLRAIIAAARKKNQNPVAEPASDASELVQQPRRFSSPVIVNRSTVRKSVLQQVLTTEAYKQSLTENATCPMLDLTGIGKDFSSPILIRNDDVTCGISNLGEHGAMRRKSNIPAEEQTPKFPNGRQSKKRLSRKVKFAEEEINHEEKPVQPMTPYTSVRGSRRRTSTVDNEEKENFQKLSPDLNKFSPIEKPTRVIRRSRRVNNS